ncbi:TetR/AcrR family transcriptional regulator [Rhodococcoides yunnanense]|uniref:TetR/AcrR family transcriptional regulator n=1 Tax=Rhodococcoides yunnanense TaxID=278209 RepID=UPI000933E73F|nr:TetR/AcrR family transcriptional regulator [Rhodococcus yunnanensis]
MGLREVHAAQTRELILDAAFSLFLDRGYDRTTMEEIAATAEVGTTTLYRYYPSKDLLVLGPLELNGQMAGELRARPGDEPLEIGLGHAVRALLVAPRAGADRMAQIYRVLDETPSLGTRLLMAFINERTLLEQAVAERLGLPSDDVYCKATARMATMVLELVTEMGPTRSLQGGDEARSRADEDLRTILALLEANPPPLPRL